MARRTNPILLFAFLILPACSQFVSAQLQSKKLNSVSQSNQVARVSSKVRRQPKLAVAEDWHAKIDKVLAKPAKFDFVDFPLREALKQLSKDCDIPFVMDKTAIEDGGFDSMVPITGAGKGRPLRMALDVLFKDLGFVCVHWRQSLLVTTKHAISNNPEKYVYYALYDISELIDDKPDDFVKVIQRTIRPQSWLDTNGGPASISVVKTRKKTILAIVQTSNGHFEVAEFLAAIREMAKE